MMADQFAIPEATLLADVMQTFKELGIAHEPVSVYQDVKDAIRYVHYSGHLHNDIIANPQV